MLTFEYLYKYLAFRAAKGKSKKDVSKVSKTCFQFNAA